MTLGGKVDRLFVWLASIASHLHLNLVHDSGIWTTRASKNPDLRDALVVIIEHHFLAAATENKQVSEMAIKDGFNNPDDMRVQFTCHPFVLQNPVRDVASRYRDIGVETMGSPRPLQHLLAELCGLPTIQYWIHLVA